MNLKTLKTAPLIILLSIFACQYANAQCKPKPFLKQHKSAMKPYRLDSYTENEIVFDKKGKKIEVLFTAYSGEYYKLMFCGDNLPQDVKVGIYDKNMKAKTRKELFTGDLKSGVNTVGPFETTKSGSYYLQFDIPPAAEGDSTSKEPTKACIITLIGFKEGK